MGPIKSAVLLGVVFVLANYLYSFYTALPPVMGGASSFEFRPVVHAYKKFIQSGSDMGSSLAVIYGDKLVVNMFGGYTDTRFRLPWTLETVTQAFTLSLISIPLTFGVLCERRSLINLSDPLTKYLPFFPTSNVTISDLLAHQSGFPYFIDSVSLVSWHDNPKAVLVNITHQVPPTKPKMQIMHLHSLALLADGIVRQVDPRQRTLGHFFMEEIAWPLGIDILIGIPRSQLYRAARTYHAGWSKAVAALMRFDLHYLWTNLWTNPWMPYGGNRERAFSLFSDYELRFNWHPDLLEIPLASSHMFTNAHGLARLLQLVLLNPNATIDDSSPPFTEAGKPHKILYSKWTLAWMLAVQDTAPAMDAVLKRPITLTNSGLMVDKSPEGNSIYGMWDDLLGQVVFVDPKRRLVFAYTTNHAHGCSLLHDPVLSQLLTAVYSCLPQDDHPV
ncbi:hypothetical protein P879_00957 [Paragonimus westermani]|uniref:Beta-lactamase-related domain-containing protein n=1 Tax=Paragonimus westermani TaxID=34504 RepID=A0A8T0DME4_9TREM|nr:hypothetical protein P879_00957 [Paragonimus westermani]